MTQLEMATAVLDNPFVEAWDALAPVPALWFMGFRFCDDDDGDVDFLKSEGVLDANGNLTPVELDTLTWGFDA